jgi:hypothetical protein
MTERYLGSIISPSPTEPSSNLSNATASGVWNIHDPLIFGQAGDWPDPTNTPSVGLIKGGYAASAPTNTVQTIVPESAGNSTDFGDLSASNYSVGALSSDTRSIAAGGYYNNSAATNTIEYFTFASAGNATDFGDLSATVYESCGVSNNVRGVICLGTGAASTIEYITIASTGNSIDFGDWLGNKRHPASVGSSTRGVFAGDTSASNVIEYITIASTSNATDFGDLTVAKAYMHGGASSSTRGVFGPASTTGNAYSNVLDYITIASTGNATDFGDAVDSTYGTSGMSNATKGIFCGGQNSGGRVNVIQQITIATTGNATDFGDLLSINSYNASTCSGNPAVQNETGFPPAAIGLLAGGDGINSAGYQSAVIFLNITTDGQSGMFGELSAKTSQLALGTAASSTRGITRIGGSPNYRVTNELEYNTFSTKGAVTDFGDLTNGSRFGGALSNSTRGVVAHGSSGSPGGEGTQSNTIDYFTIASAGNASDFGDLTISNNYMAGVAGTTRGIFAGGLPSGSYTDVIEYITIASTGNGTDFGDLIETNFSVGMVSSNTRAVMGSGGRSSNQMQYVTIASTGNATDFGDATGSGSYNYATGLSASTIGLFHNYNSTYNVDKITIASTGDATDWGDLTWGAGQAGGTSNAHGGL